MAEAGQLVKADRNPYYSNLASRATFSYANQTGGAGGARIATVTFKAPGNQALTKPLKTRVFLSSSADGLTPVAATTAMTVTTGTTLKTNTSNADIDALTTTAGVLGVTVTGAGTKYPVVVLPDGSISVGSALVIT